MPDDLTVEDVVSRVVQALDAAGVDYAVGGSVASSRWGEPRSSNDVDIAVRLQANQIPRFVETLGPDFAVDEQALLEAVKARRSWNIYFLPLMLKIDLFVRGNSAFDESEFSRRRVESLVPNSPPVYLSSPEDNLLWKMKWFRMGGEVSDQQWRDIIGIVSVLGEKLDTTYLRRWANDLGVGDVLERALQG